MMHPYRSTPFFFVRFPVARRGTIDEYSFFAEIPPADIARGTIGG